MFNTVPLARTGTAAFPGGGMSVSANGSTNGILWATTATTSARISNAPGVLHAYDATNVENEFWNSYQNKTRDDYGSYAKFNSPTVANGKVYVPSFPNSLAVYGLLGTPSLTVAPVVPSSGTGSVQSFAGTYSATKGYHDLQWVQVLFAVAPDGGGQPYCFVHYDVQGNSFWLYGDGGFFVGPVTPGTPSNLLQNSLCALITSGSTVSGSGPTLSVIASVVFKAAGTRNVYVRAQNLEGEDTGWIQEDTWNTVAAAPGTMLVNPASGSSTNSAQQTFTLTYPDPAGFAGAAFGWEQFLVAAAADGGGQPFCFVHYDRAGKGLWMYSSDVGFFLGPVTPGAASSVLNSSACSVNTAGTTVANTSGNLVLTVPITMKTPMVGAKNTYQRTLDVLSRDSGFVQTGNWTIH